MLLVANAIETLGEGNLILFFGVPLEKFFVGQMVRMLLVANAIVSGVAKELSLIQQHVAVDTADYEGDYDYDGTDVGKGKSGKKGENGPAPTVAPTLAPTVAPTVAPTEAPTYSVAENGNSSCRQVHTGALRTRA